VISAVQHALHCDGAFDGGVTFRNYGTVESKYVGIRTTANDDRVYNYGTIDAGLAP
jgi:hypothetical protein